VGKNEVKEFGARVANANIKISLIVRKFVLFFAKV
jgi:hypothetical protein